MKTEPKRAVTISIGSGKGGTGKTMLLCNLAMLLARKGKKVCLVDLDIGGSDAHLQFGLFEPRHSLTDYLTKKVGSIEDVLHPFPSFNDLQMIPGTGNTLRTANMTYQEKQRLLRDIASLDADIVLIDVGAGTSFHTLDFFMFSDVQICVTMPEAPSILDFYNFLQLATIRKILQSFLSHSDIGHILKEQNFSSMDAVFELAEETQEGARKKAEEALYYFQPLLVINRDVTGTIINKTKLKQMVAKYLGIDIPLLGEIPDDPEIKKALKAYRPVCELYPDAAASKAIYKISCKLDKIVDLFKDKQLQ